MARRIAAIGLLLLLLTAFSYLMVIGMACHPLTIAFVSGAPECPIE